MAIKKWKTQEVFFQTLIMTLFGLFALICFFPFYYITINTLSANDLVASGKLLVFPVGLHFTNYIQAITVKGILPATFVSIGRTIFGTFFTVLTASFLGYCMTKQEYWHRTFWYRFLIVTMYFSAGLIPWYILMKTLGLMNNYLAYILPALSSPFNTVLCKTYIESLPSSLEESAEIDGAGYLRRYFNIIIPLSMPILATVAVFTAVSQWNAFMDTVFLMTKSQYFTLQFVLYKFLNETTALAEMIKLDPSFAELAANLQLTPVSVRFTISVITLLPVMFVYPFFQRYFVKGIMIGAIKG